MQVYNRTAKERYQLDRLQWNSYDYFKELTTTNRESFLLSRSCC